MQLYKYWKIPPQGSIMYFRFNYILIQQDWKIFFFTRNAQCFNFEKKKNYRHNNNNRLCFYHFSLPSNNLKVFFFDFTLLILIFTLFENGVRGIIVSFYNVWLQNREVGKGVFTIMLHFLLLVFSTGILIWLGHLRTGKEFLLQEMDFSARRLWP